MLRRPNYHSPSHSRGVGLIEVLIAVLVMAIGMLGIASMQATALRNSQSSLERSQAVIQSYAVFDAMRANLDQARAGAYNLAMCAVPGGGGSLASKDLSNWVASLDRTINATACGQITCVAAGGAGGAQNCTVTVQWDDSRGTEGEQAYTVETESRI